MADLGGIGSVTGWGDQVVPPDSVHLVGWAKVGQRSRMTEAVVRLLLVFARAARDGG